MLSDAFVRVECDGKNCKEYDDISLCPLAHHGAYDMRNVQSWLDHNGWKTVSENEHYCENCAEDMETADAPK